MYLFNVCVCVCVCVCVSQFTFEQFLWLVVKLVCKLTDQHPTFLSTVEVLSLEIFLFPVQEVN